MVSLSVISRYTMAAALLVGLLLSVGCSEERSRLVNGQPAPAFTLEHLEKGSLGFPQDLDGKVVAIRFWADWCPFCESEMQAMESVYQVYREQGLVILAINVRQDRKTAEDFIGKLDISYEVLLDTDGTVARTYGVIGLPTTFMVDRNGNLYNRILGESTPEVFEKIVRELL